MTPPVAWFPEIDSFIRNTRSAAGYGAHVAALYRNGLIDQRTFAMIDAALIRNLKSREMARKLSYHRARAIYWAFRNSVVARHG